MAYKRAVAVPRAGLLVAMLVWRHTLRVSAEYCPGISVNTLVETTVNCDGSAWLGQAVQHPAEMPTEAPFLQQPSLL